MKKAIFLLLITLSTVTSLAQMRVVDLWVPDKTTTFKQIMPSGVSFVYENDSNKTYRLTAKFDATNTMIDVFGSGNYVVANQESSYLTWKHTSGNFTGLIYPDDTLKLPLFTYFSLQNGYFLAQKTTRTNTRSGLNLVGVSGDATIYAQAANTSNEVITSANIQAVGVIGSVAINLLSASGGAQQYTIDKAGFRPSIKSSLSGTSNLGGNYARWDQAYVEGLHVGSYTVSVTGSCSIPPTIPESLWSRVSGSTNDAYSLHVGNTGIGTTAPAAKLDIAGRLAVTSAAPLVGSSLQGGVVAYVLNSGDPGYDAVYYKGLICTPADYATPAAWGCYGVSISGTSTAVGTGQANTTLIVNGCSDAGIAARICDDLVYGGYSDWYLPSKDELNYLYQNKTAIGGFVSNYYWSSTNRDAELAWTQIFSNGGQGFFNKTYTYYVRPVRTFSIPALSASFVGGNVGIGTTDVASGVKLEINGYTRAKGLYSSVVTGDPAIYGFGVFSIGVKALSTSGTALDAFSTSGTAGYFKSGTGYAAIFEQGKVGVGITNPSYPLDVFTNTAAPAIYGRSNQTSAGASGIKGSGYYGVFGTSPSAYAGYFEGTSTGKGIYVTTSSADFPSAIFMNGYVGISNTNPQTQLEVSGVITATGGNSTNWNTAYNWTTGAGSTAVQTSTLTSGYYTQSVSDARFAPIATANIANNAYSMWALTKKIGWINNDSSSLSFNAADSTLTFTRIGPLRYIRNGVICTVTATQTKKITGNLAGKSKSYFYIDSDNGVIIESQSAWSLNDNKVTIATVDWDKTSCNKYLLHDERHLAQESDMHHYLHTSMGARYQSGGILSGQTILPTTATSIANTFGITATYVTDDGLDHTLAALTDPAATDHAYLKYYRTSANVWKWDTTAVPYIYSSTYIRYDNGGTLVTGTNGNYYNSYLLFSNIDGIGRYLIVPGRGEYVTAILARSENPLLWDWSGFDLAECVIMFRFTFLTGSGFTGALGRVKLAEAPTIINQSVSSAATAVSYATYDENIYAQGLKWNQNLDTYTRLGSISVAPHNASPGSGALPVQGRMRGCVLTNGGAVNYYLQEDNWSYKEDGTASNLTGTDGQVMVEIPAFYTKYKYLNNTVEWWISQYPLSGYTLHPAFNIAGVTKPYLYISAYEGVLYDNSASIYANGVYQPAHSVTFAAADSSLTTAAMTNPYTSLAVGDIIVVTGTTNNNATFVVKTIGDTKIKVTTVPTNETAANTVISTQRDYTATTGDQLSSVSGKVPLSYFTRAQSRQMAKNRGTGWHQFGYDEANAIELLILIEYGTFYIQNIAEVGPGITAAGNWLAYNNYNPFVPSGNGDTQGNLSADNAGAATCGGDKTKYSRYRGIENIYGHVWKWVDGININNNAPYVTSNHVNWAENTATNYDVTGVTLANANGYQNTLVNSGRVMLPATVGGIASASVKITDYYYQLSGWRVAGFGGGAHYGGDAGPWDWSLSSDSGYAYQHIAARVAF